MQSVSQPGRSRSYWKDYDQKEDEGLALELLDGRSVCDQVGRLRTEYVPPNSPRERLAREALARLLSHYRRDAGHEGQRMIHLLCEAFAEDGKTQRRLVFQFRKKGKRSDLAADYQALHCTAANVRFVPKPDILRCGKNVAIRSPRRRVRADYRRR
jgi:hypothetical protein